MNCLRTPGVNARSGNPAGKLRERGLRKRVRASPIFVTWKLLHAALPSFQEINQDKLRKIGRVGKVCFAVGHRGHLLNELNQVIVAGQHEGIDHDAGFATGLDFER